jgi:hypothetical protein
MLFFLRNLRKERVYSPISPPRLTGVGTILVFVSSYLPGEIFLISPSYTDFSLLVKSITLSIAFFFSMCFLYPLLIRRVSKMNSSPLTPGDLMSETCGKFGKVLIDTVWSFASFFYLSLQVSILISFFQKMIPESSLNPFFNVACFLFIGKIALSQKWMYTADVVKIFLTIITIFVLVIVSFLYFGGAYNFYQFTTPSLFGELRTSCSLYNGSEFMGIILIFLASLLQPVQLNRLNLLQKTTPFFYFAVLGGFLIFCLLYGIGLLDAAGHLFLDSLLPAGNLLWLLSAAPFGVKAVALSGFLAFLIISAAMYLLSLLCSLHIKGVITLLDDTSSSHNRWVKIGVSLPILGAAYLFSYTQDVFTFIPHYPYYYWVAIFSLPLLNGLLFIHILHRFFLKLFLA